MEQRQALADALAGHGRLSEAVETLRGAAGLSSAAPLGTATRVRELAGALQALKLGLAEWGALRAALGKATAPGATGELEEFLQRRGAGGPGSIDVRAESAQLVYKALAK